MADIFGAENGLNLHTYILDNYGHQAVEAVNDWRANVSSQTESLQELVKRFSRLTLLPSVSFWPVEQDQL